MSTATQEVDRMVPMFLMNYVEWQKLCGEWQAAGGGVLSWNYAAPGRPHNGTIGTVFADAAARRWLEKQGR